ncbi:MAG: protein disulfide oxidoreductase [Gammaproteobacteria bacterium]|nr:protein disulfide oxidoreductase [Gammaproteobacteria bacterium]
MRERIVRIGKKLPKLLLELGVVLLLVLALEAWLTRDAVSGKAPLFSAQTIAGEAFDLRSLQGSPALVHFWATWCPVCELEQGSIDAVAGDHSFISVAMQSGSEQEILDYLREQGVDYPVVSDPEGRLSRRYGVSGVPASFILDGEGEVRFVTRGYTSSWGLRIRLWLAGTL